MSVVSFRGQPGPGLSASRCGPGRRGRTKGGKSGKGTNEMEKGEKGEKGTQEAGKRNVAQSFEDLHVYQRARELANDVYAQTRKEGWRGDHDLREQIRRAAVSIMSNIAEGFERGAKNEFVQFLYIAKGSSGEIRAQLHVARDQNYIDEADYLRLLDRARRVSGMLSNFIGHLQQTSHQGEKYTRPRRQASTAQQKRIEALRAAQPSSPQPKKTGEDKTLPE